MLRKILISAVALGAFAVAAPALAGNYGGSTSGWNKPKPPKYPSSSTSSGNTSTSGGTKVPEPGMLGMAAAGLIGIGAIQLRRRKLAKR